MIVIFLSTEAKTCNTIFSRQKKKTKKKELRIKRINIFDLNIWMALGTNRPFVLWTECLETRDFSKETVVESGEGLGSTVTHDC